MDESIKYDKKIDERNPKDILRTEMYLTIPMVRRILNCNYDYARRLINQIRESDKAKKIFVVPGRNIKVKTESFKDFLENGY